MRKKIIEFVGDCVTHMPPPPSAFMQNCGWALCSLYITAVILAPHMAHAQGITGGNGGFIAPVIQWFMQNFIGGLIEIGVIVGGVILMFMRLHLAGLVTMIVGSLIVTNYEALAALL